MSGTLETDANRSDLRGSTEGSTVSAYLRALLARHAGNDAGEVASYIPELSFADPALFGICLATVDGAVYEAGDTGVPFTIQSMSKPLTYGLALERLGAEATRSRIGVEPSGDAFNEISVAPATGVPRNPLINAGAIACAGLVASDTDDPFALLLETYSRYAGRQLELDQAVFLSESETGHRNRGMAHILRSFEMVDEPEAALDLYFRQCSVSVDTRDLAMIAATLANGGVHPVTGVRAVSEEVVRDMLSVTASCGMYDFAGEWLVSVGLPAKSGVSGGIFAVLPGRLGIGVFSPPLDEHGNTVRGIAVCRDLSSDLSIHLVRPGERPAPPVRAAYTLADRPSKRVRSADHRQAIHDAAARTVVVEVQGELGFSACEALARHVERGGEPPELVIVDTRRVDRIDSSGARFLGAIAENVDARGGVLAIAPGDLPDLDELRQLSTSVLRFPSVDAGLEWCEDELLRRVGQRPALLDVAIEQHELLAGLDSADLELLLPSLDAVNASEGSFLVRQGDPADRIYLVTRGSLSVVRDCEDGTNLRLTTLSAGMTFGELAYIERGKRAAGVRADTDVECRTMAFTVLDEIESSHPVLHNKLLRTLLANVVSSLQAVTGELAYWTS